MTTSKQIVGSVLRRITLKIPFISRSSVPDTSLPQATKLLENENSETNSTSDSSEAITQPYILACLQETQTGDDEQSQTGGDNHISDCIIYLHGFPDQSIEHRQNEENYGQFSTRLPIKLAEMYASANQNLGFCALNFSGTPGSFNEDSLNATLSFFNKTVSQEVFDVMNLMSYLNKFYNYTGFHIIGISTGAIIGSVLRGEMSRRRQDLDLGSNSDKSTAFKIKTISIIAACGADIQKALEIDFNQEQLKDFEEKGYCHKDFWLGYEKTQGISSINGNGHGRGIWNPRASKDNDGDEEIKRLEEKIKMLSETEQTVALGASDQTDIEKSESNDTTNPNKCDTVTVDTAAEEVSTQSQTQSNQDTLASLKELLYTKFRPRPLKLSVNYRDDFLTNLKIAENMSLKHDEIQNQNTPVLFLHGTQDKSVPLQEGKDLFDITSEPKKFVEVNKGNHLMTNSKDLKKCIKEIMEWQGIGSG